jgi:hypothetical protein
MTQFCWHVAALGQMVLLGAAPQLPQLRLVLFFWWIQCENESNTRDVLCAVQPPDLVHL